MSEQKNQSGADTSQFESFTTTPSDAGAQLQEPLGESQPTEGQPAAPGGTTEQTADGQRGDPEGGTHAADEPADPPIIDGAEVHSPDGNDGEDSEDDGIETIEGTNLDTVGTTVRETVADDRPQASGLQAAEEHSAPQAEPQSERALDRGAEVYAESHRLNTERYINKA